MDDSILLCVKDLTSFFEKPIAQKAVKPIRSGVELAVYIDDAGPISLRKNDATLEVLSTPPQNPDMTFRTTPGAIKKLAESTTDDLGEIGVEICKLMLSSDPKLQLRAKVHIGTWDLLRNGYLGIIPLGGPTLMKFLATKGFGSIGKIKDALSRLRG